MLSYPDFSGNPHKLRRIPYKIEFANGFKAGSSVSEVERNCPEILRKRILWSANR